MADRKSFVREGVRELREKVGAGKLVGKLRVDQIYAKYQHERLDLKHPRGGGPKYLERPLYEHYSDYYKRLARAIPGGDVEHEMVRCMEALDSAMSSAAPIDHNNLRRSGNPRVYSNGRKVYDRAPHQRRMSDRELKLLRRRGRGLRK